MRERTRRDEERSPAVVPAPAPATPADLVTRLQRSAGNAYVSRLLAEQELERPDAAVPPHAPDDRGEDLFTLGPDAFGEPEQDEPLRDVFASQDVVSAQTPVQAPAPAVPAPVTAWLALQPTTNTDIAQWLLDGETLGFITFAPDQRPQIADLAAGKSELSAYVGDRSSLRPLKVDTSKALGLLTILHGLTRARAKRWTANTSLPKSPVVTGDMIRNLKGSITDAHKSGASADLFPTFDWKGPKGPAQIIEVLGDLPPGKYTIGLPMQGDFFPEDKWLANAQTATLARGDTETPPSFIYFQTIAWKSTHAPDKPGKYKWNDEQEGTLVVGFLKSAALKSAIAALASKGITIDVMPDYPNHIHITRR